MDINEQLRAQSKLLLQRLKARQAQLQHGVGFHTQNNEEYSQGRQLKHCNTETSEQLDASTSGTRQISGYSRQQILQKLNASQKKEVIFVM